MAPSVAALPLLKTIEDCADYSKSVEPYIDQFYQLLPRLVASASSIEALQRLYVETNPLITGFSASLFVAGVCLIVSEINRNYSQIDRLWSILPNLHVVHLALWARMTGLPHARIDLVAIFTTAWSVSDLGSNPPKIPRLLLDLTFLFSFFFFPCPSSSSFFLLLFLLTGEVSRFASSTTIGAEGVTRLARKTIAGTL